MPFYSFGLLHMNSASLVEWHPDDVAALQAAAKTTAELVRNRRNDEPIPLVMAFRVENE